MKDNIKSPSGSKSNKTHTVAPGKAAKTEAPRRRSVTNRSEHDDQDYDGRNFSNDDYKGKNFQDEDDYNSGKLGRGADVSEENNVHPIPKRKSKQ